MALWGCGWCWGRRCHLLFHALQSAVQSPVRWPPRGKKHDNILVNATWFHKLQQHFLNNENVYDKNNISLSTTFHRTFNKTQNFRWNCIQRYTTTFQKLDSTKAQQSLNSIRPHQIANIYHSQYTWFSDLYRQDPCIVPWYICENVKKQ